MPSEIRVYFDGDPKLRPGFDELFGELHRAARECGIAIHFVGCKARTAKSFRLALEDYPDALNLLLMDAESPVSSTDAWEHLRTRSDNQVSRPQGTSAGQAHLMVQLMESWFLADREMLSRFYGQKFLASRLPARADVENVAKKDVISTLRAATRRTPKGDYHKTRHAPELLARLSRERVCDASPWCKRLFETIERAIEAAG